MLIAFAGIQLDQCANRACGREQATQRLQTKDPGGVLRRIEGVRQAARHRAQQPVGSSAILIDVLLPIASNSSAAQDPPQPKNPTGGKAADDGKGSAIDRRSPRLSRVTAPFNKRSAFYGSFRIIARSAPTPSCRRKVSRKSSGWRRRTLSITPTSSLRASLQEFPSGTSWSRRQNISALGHAARARRPWECHQGILAGRHPRDFS
jgi:hypothetical protein